MVNVGLNPGALLGVVLFVAGAGLYFLRSVRPELARDHDIFFMAVAILSGGILFFQGWRLDPILTFGQFLLAGAAVFFAVESIRLRGLATEKAKRNTPIVDDDRPVSRTYNYERQYAQLDELEPEAEPQIRGQIGGSRSTRSRGSSTGYYDDEDSSRRPTRRSSPSRPSTPSDRRSRRPRPDDRVTKLGTDWEDESEYGSDPGSAYGSEYGTDLGSDYGSEYGGYSANQETPPRPRPSSGSTRPRRPRPTSAEEGSPRRERRDNSSDYVDYSPIDSSEVRDDRGEGADNYDDE